MTTIIRALVTLLTLALVLVDENDNILGDDTRPGGHDLFDELQMRARVQEAEEVSRT